MKSDFDRVCPRTHDARNLGSRQVGAVAERDEFPVALGECGKGLGEGEPSDSRLLEASRRRRVWRL